MTEALDAMVKAMAAEFVRQDAQRLGVGALVDGGEVSLIGDFDLEKVARAGLAAIRKPTTEIIIAGGGVPDSVQRFWPEMIDAILET